MHPASEWLSKTLDPDQLWLSTHQYVLMVGCCQSLVLSVYVSRHYKIQLKASFHCLHIGADLEIHEQFRGASPDRSGRYRVNPQGHCGMCAVMTHFVRSESQSKFASATWQGRLRFSWKLLRDHWTSHY